MSNIDDLINELYPAKRSATQATPDIAGAAAGADKFSHSFDDDSPRAGAAPNSAAPKSNAGTTVARAGTSAAVPWPTLPPNIGPTLHCGGTEVTLTCHVSEAARREQRRLLHLTPAQLGSPTQCRPPRAGLDDDGGRWCPYVRCAHCGHVVVRMEGAYWTRGAAEQRRSTGSSPVQQNGGAPPTAAQASPTGNAHSFDDDTDEEDSAPAPAPAAGQTAAPSPPPGAKERDDEAMYMLMRYHYPDFAAFPRDVIVHVGPSTPAGCPAAPGVAAAAAYCCQCSWVSVFEPALRVAAPMVGTGPVKLPPQPSAPTAVPVPTSKPAGVQWVCRGHCQS